MPRSSKQLPSIRERLLAQQQEINERPRSGEELATAAEASFHAIPGGLLIPIERIDTWDRQPRKTFADAAIDELAASIAGTGLLEPLVVRRDPDAPGRYLIVAGHRRLLALRRLHGSESGAVRARVAEIPCIVREVSDDVAFAEALVENLIRTDLTRKETMDAFVSLQDEYGWGVREIARRTGRNPGDVSDVLGVARDPELSTLVATDRIAVATATLIKPLRDPRIRSAVMAWIDDLVTAAEADGREGPVVTGATVKQVIGRITERQTAPTRGPGGDAATARTGHVELPDDAGVLVNQQASRESGDVDQGDAPAPVLVNQQAGGTQERATAGGSGGAGAHPWDGTGATAAVDTPARASAPEGATQDAARTVEVAAHTRRVRPSGGEADEAAIEGLVRDLITTLQQTVVVGPATLRKLQELIDYLTGFVEGRSR